MINNNDFVLQQILLQNQVTQQTCLKTRGGNAEQLSKEDKIFLIGTIIVILCTCLGLFFHYEHINIWSALTSTHSTSEQVEEGDHAEHIQSSGENAVVLHDNVVIINGEEGVEYQINAQVVDGDA